MDPIDVGQKKYGRCVRMFREGYLSVCVYKNVFEHKTFYDVVVYRKIKDREGNSSYQRGTNLRPTDLPVALRLLQSAQEYLETV